MKIKEIKRIAAVLCVGILGVQTAEAQLFDKLKNRVKETVENRAVDKAGDVTNKGLDKVEEGITGANENKSTDNPTDGPPASPVGNQNVDGGTLISYANYDFVAGDKLIYHYDMAGEADAEIPGRMVLNAGSAEIQTYNGEKVLVAPALGEPYMMPYMEDNAYLPDQFTMEFDVLSNGMSNTDGSEITLYFREKDRAGSGDATAPLRVTLSVISGDENQPHYGFEGFKNDKWFGTPAQGFPSAASNPKQNNWRHVAIYINKNIGKLYMDQHRLAVLNQVDAGKIDMVEIEVRGSGNPVLFKNFRIAAGGTDAYNKVVTEGRFIAYGIQFDVNKATLKPESMGTINEFVQLMTKHPELKFEIGGHTDSDGTAQLNHALSQQRAEAVKAQMVKMGIDAGRLTTKGYGADSPVAPNDHAENKARNRRVEFVKTT